MRSRAEKDTRSLRLGLPMPFFAECARTGLQSSSTKDGSAGSRKAGVTIQGRRVGRVAWKTSPRRELGET
jgi:hypothetical protein